MRAESISVRPHAGATVLSVLELRGSIIGRHLGYERQVSYNHRVAEETPFPYPCEDVPRFDTKHAVATLIAEYKAKGYIKQCAHVRIGTIGAGMYRTDYTPKWGEDSFDVTGVSFGKKRFHGCPKDCRLYESVWKGIPKKWLKEKWWPFRGFIVGTAEWYASLSMPAQVILALGVLALMSSPWSNTVLEGLKIIFAK